MVERRRLGNMFVATLIFLAVFFSRSFSFNCSCLTWPLLAYFAMTKAFLTLVAIDFILIVSRLALLLTAFAFSWAELWLTIESRESLRLS